jgi:hypothetical protein
MKATNPSLGALPAPNYRELGHATNRVSHGHRKKATYFPQGRLWEVDGGAGGGKSAFWNIIAILL